jgi:hypothetical protein
VFNSLVLSARALPITGRPEDALAEKAALLGLESTVVDGFWVLDLAVAPRTHHVRSGYGDANIIKPKGTIFTN